MILQQGKTYIQRNPLFGRKVLRVEHLSESIWGWNLCDLTIVTIDKDPSIVKIKRAASSIYDHQGLVEIPDLVYKKIQTIVKLYLATESASEEETPEIISFRQETLGQIIKILMDSGIIDEETYSDKNLRIFAEQYDNYSREQMTRVTDVIDVHK